MAELTQEDQKNYDKLKEAFLKHNQEKDNDDETLKVIIPLLVIENIPKNTDELRSKIDTLDLYLKILELRSIELFKVDPSGNQSPKNKEEKEKLEQQLSDAIENLKRSLQVVEADKVDLTGEIENFQPDSLFFDFITDKDPKKWTKTLIEDRDPNLTTDDEINRLIQAWDTAVNSFVEDARKNNGTSDNVIPRQPVTFAHFFRIYKELEVLYSRLADTDTAQKIR